MTTPASGFRWLRSRLPAWAELAALFGLVLFVLHAWSFQQYFFFVPSFILKFDPGQILAILFYHTTFALIESLAVCLLLVAVSALLPPAWLRDHFAARGLLVFLLLVAASFALQRSFIDGVLTLDAASPIKLYVAVAGALLLLAALLILCARFPRLQQALASLTDRFSVMLFLFLPLDAIGLVLLAWRLVH